MTDRTRTYDDELRNEYPIIVGCDEVGRGCLAGPIVTAAVVLPPGIDIEGVTDSKKIKKSHHREIADKIIEVAIDIQIGIKDAEYIDEHDILQADKDAMIDSINKLNVIPNLILIDGNESQLLHTKYEEQTVIKGDDVSLSIAAASVMAKTVRDEIMRDYNNKYPGYGFDTNAGYGTPKHKEAIFELGVTPIHRKSFEPIKSNIDTLPINNGV